MKVLQCNDYLCGIKSTNINDFMSVRIKLGNKPGE